ncbi:leucyl aminopeptidase [Rhodoferax sp.]|uniref:leucyl aminopeptidase n=1 Tax=Rhodoferax sp. TaxID=50421 RepID=UPI00374DC9FF
MNFELETLDLSAASKEKCDALIVLITSSFKPGKDALSVLVAQALKAGDLENKAGKALLLYRPTGLACVRAVLVNGGDGSANEVSKAVKTAVLAVKAGNVKKLVICFATLPQAALLRAAVTAVAEASYVFTTTKSKPEGRVIQRVVMGVSHPAGLKPVFDRAVAAVAGIEFAKEWANRPANYATPALLAGAARSLAKLPNIKCEVLGPKQVKKLGMGSFMAVAQGSEEPLRFIVLRYDGALKSEAPTVLVGKGITFDSGGISIKPAADMDEMKFDMSGAASVLGVFKVLAELKPAINVIGLIPACENLLDGRSIKPGDVVTSMSGQTIEILNTDAEGRLVLCDALTYAERFKPRAVVDIATLTGACVVALGAVRSGLFSANDELAAALMSAGETSLDLCWRLPLDDDYAEGLKTDFADVANVAGRAGGAITAAKFLQRFTAKFPWAHLDIAGTAWKSGKAKGATGRPVALLLEYLLTSAK